MSKCIKVAPDAKYNSFAAAKLINAIMMEGKKETARKIVYSAISGEVEKIMSEMYENNMDKALQEVLNMAAPSAEIKSKRIGRTIYKFPVNLPADKKLAKGAKNIAKAIRSKSGNASDKLKKEFLCILKGEGSETAKMKQKIEEEINSNKALASAYMRNFS